MSEKTVQNIPLLSKEPCDSFTPLFFYILQEISGNNFCSWIYSYGRMKTFEVVIFYSYASLSSGDAYIYIYSHI